MTEAASAELEALIAEDPCDDEAWHVYADWLLEHGNPRGALARVQLERERAPQDRGLRAEEQQLLGAHAAQIRGAWVDPHHPPDPRATPFLEDHCEVTYRGGFWRSIVFRGPIEALAALLAHPSARLLHTLHVHSLSGYPERYDRAVQILGAARQEVLRELYFGYLPPGDELPSFARGTAGSLEPLVQACPRLEVLRLLVPHFVMAPLPRLRLLDARLGATEESVRSLARVCLPRLQELHLGFDDGVGEVLPDLLWQEDALDSLLEGVATPHLRHLYLWLADQAAPHPLEARVRASVLGQRLTSFLMVQQDEPDELEIYAPEV